IETPRVECRQESAGVAIAEIAFAARGGGQPREHALGQTAGAVASPRKPERIDTLVIRDLEESARPGLVVPGKMPRGKETLGMEAELRRAIWIELARELQGRLGDRGLESRGGRHNPNDEFPRSHPRFPLWRAPLQLYRPWMGRGTAYYFCGIGG